MRGITRHVAASWFVAVWMVIGASASNAAQKVSASIVAFEGDRGCITIARGKGVIKAMVLTQLRRGDRIHVSCRAKVTFEYSDGRLATADHLSSPVTVLEGDTMADRELDALGNKMSDAYDQLQSTVALGDSDAPSVTLPGLREGVAQIGAGSRRLVLEWVGGRAPYTIEISGPSGDSMRSPIRSMTTSIATITALRFVEGRYQLRITDGVGRTEVVGFSVVSPSSIPNPTISDYRLSSRTESAVRALRLRDVDPARWTFEAYLRIAGADVEARDLTPFEATAKKLLTVRQ